MRISSAVPVADLATRDVVALGPDLNLRDAIGVLTSRHISGAPVLAGKRVVGVVSLTDIIAQIGAFPPTPEGLPEPADWELEPAQEWEEGEEAPGAYFTDWWVDLGADVTARFAQTQPEWDPLGEHTVGEVMTRTVCSVSPEASVADAAAYMLHADVHRLLVMKDSRLLGIITTKDVLRAVAGGSG